MGYTDPEASTISGLLWLDDNLDGIINSGESGISEIEVNIMDLEGIIRTTQTNSLGGYSFTNIRGSTYQVNVTNTHPKLNGLIASTLSRTVNVAVNQTVNNVNFSFEDPFTSSISGTLFNDVNQNGIKDDGELPSNNMTVNLLKDSIVIANAMSITDGIYEFSNLQAGTYEVTIDMSTIPDGFVVSQPSSKTINLGLASLSNNIDLGITDSATSTISGSVKIDTNPVQNVNVFLTHPDGTRETTLTDPNGVFQFDNLLGC